MGINLFSFLIVLGVLVFVHELGHFLMARFFNVGVIKFSLGFGPRVFGKIIGRTDYCLSAIPLGGFVKMVGEESNIDVSDDDMKYSFSNKHVFERILIVAAGPFFNFGLAVLIFYIMFQISGLTILKPIIGMVQEESPAFIAGIQKNDIVKSINGVTVEDWTKMSDLINNCKGKEIKLKIVRDGFPIDIILNPKCKIDKNLFGEEVERYIIGIVAAGKTYTKTLNFFQAFNESLIQTWKITSLTITSVGKMIQGIVSADSMGGPIMIAQMAGDQARKGVDNFLFFIALLSINLGILNLFPVPVLDGGHLLFFSIEAIIGHPINEKTQVIAQQVGIFLLLSLMVFVCYNDISKLISNWS